MITWQRLLPAVLLLLAVAGCGAAQTHRMADVLSEAQRRAGNVPVRLLASVHPAATDQLLIYQYKRRETCGSGAVLLRPGQPEQWLGEEHACSSGEAAISLGTSGRLGDYALTYGLVFSALVSRVTAVDAAGGTADAHVKGGAWWVLGATQPASVQAFDRSGRLLLTLRP